MADFLLITPSLFHPNFVGVPAGPDRDVGASPSQNLKLSSREIIFEVFQPVCKSHTQTDRWTTDCGITVLCVASRGKNRKGHNNKKLKENRGIRVPK